MRVRCVAVEAGDVEGAAPGITPGQRFVGLDDNGARVACSPTLICGVCDRCRAGLGPHCRQRHTLGVDVDGCLAPVVSLPARNLVALPDAVDDDLGALAWTLAESLHAVRLAPESKYITVIGDTHRAVLTARCARAGSDGARLLMPSRDLFPVAERWGIRHRLTDEAGRRADQDVVIVASGDPSHLALALDLVRPRGRVIVQAPSPSHASLHAGQIAEHEIEVVGARGGSLAEAVRVLSRGGIEASLLVTKRVRFDQLDGAPSSHILANGLTIVDFD